MDAAADKAYNSARTDDDVFLGLNPKGRTMLLWFLLIEWGSQLNCACVSHSPVLVLSAISMNLSTNLPQKTHKVCACVHVC
eukprot:462114-Amphidinium_carterae.1